MTKRWRKVLFSGIVVLITLISYRLWLWHFVTTVPFTFKEYSFDINSNEKYRGHLIVDVYTRGEVKQLLLDTGSSICLTQGSVKYNFNNNTAYVYDFGHVHDEFFRIGHDTQHVHCATYEYAPQFKTSFDATECQGMLGTSFFEGVQRGYEARIILDNKGQTLTIDRSPYRTPYHLTQKTIVVHLIRTHIAPNTSGYCYEIPVSINGGPVCNCVLDTGCPDDLAIRPDQFVALSGIKKINSMGYNPVTLTIGGKKLSARTCTFDGLQNSPPILGLPLLMRYSSCFR